MVDMEGMGDKYDQNTLCDFLKHLIKVLYENWTSWVYSL